MEQLVPGDELRLKQQLAALYALRDQKQLEEEKELALHDLPMFSERVAGLSLCDRGDSEGWFDFRENGPHWHINRHLRRKNRKHKAVFAPRAGGKTKLVLTLCLQDYLWDHNFTMLIHGETLPAAAKRADFLRARLEILDPIYGPLITNHWAKDSFTIQRTMGRTDQPSLSITAPGTGITGLHPKRILVEDSVGESSFESPADMRKGKQSFKKMWAQKLPGTVIWVIGTMWPGDNIHTDLLERMERGLKWKEIAPGIWRGLGKFFDVLKIVATTSDGQAVFPHLPLEFLAEQKAGLGTAFYLSQYYQQIVRTTDISFEPEMFHIADPPEGVTTLRYMLTDPASSTRRIRGTSKSCLAIVDLVPGDKAYVRQIVAGKLAPPIFVDNALQMYQEWKPIYIVMENTGPGALYPDMIRERASHEGIEVPVFHPEVSRWKTGKNLRIQALLPYFEQNRIFFSPSINPAMFHMQNDGQIVGMVADEFFKYSLDDPDSYDCIDALADIVGKDKNGQRYCEPPMHVEMPKELNTYQKAVAHVLRRQSRRRFL